MATRKVSDEKPLNIKSTLGAKVKSPKTSQLNCIIHYTSNKSHKLRQLSDHSFQTIQEKKEIRQKSDKANERLDHICDNIPTTFYKHLHGTHVWCYKNFTNVSKIVKRKYDMNDMESFSSRPKRVKMTTREDESSPLFSKTVCLICNKYRKKVKGNIEIPIKCQTLTAEQTLKATAEKLSDYRMLGQIAHFDLKAREAHYHPTCRRNYTREGDRNKNKKVHIEVKQEQEAHQAAFEHLCQYVNESIIQRGNVERVTMLKEKYLLFMQEQRPDFYNPCYKTDKLKDKLQKKYGRMLQFWQPNYKSELVYSLEIPKGQAIEVAFEVAASETKRIEEAALVLRRTILDAHKGTPGMPWPPSKDFLLGDDIQIPPLLQDFLTVLIAGGKTAGAKKAKVVQSISQDLCKATTRGQWMMPKHLLLGMTIRHLTGSAEIVTIVNRFGHCASYSYLLELETAMCDSITDRVGILPPSMQVEDSKVTHFCWDNFDLTEETTTGTGTTHSAHGIIIQEVSINTGSRQPDGGNRSVSRTKKRSVSYIPHQITPCFAKPKAEPVLPLSLIKFSQDNIKKVAEFSDSLWLLSRFISQGSNQTVPSWAGWVSLTGNVEEEVDVKSKVDYMPPVNAPITENATVQHIIRVSQAASREINQEYTIVTFDLAVAKKAYAIVWQDSCSFRDVIIRLGVFHTTCAYLGVLGKRMRSSGFEDILIESGICASGSIEKVMSGKHYNRAMHVHKTMLEALERLLLQKYETTVGELLRGEARDIMERLALAPNQQLLEEAMANEDCTEMIRQYSAFKDEIRNGEHGKTAKFWIDYMDKVLLVLLFQRATKENNLDLHIFCLQELCPLFFSYDHPNYARYTTVYMLSMLNLHLSHPGAEKLLCHGLSVSRSDVKSSRNAVDITIEQTINRHAKSHGGIIGFSRKYGAYMRWCLTRHCRAEYVQGTFQMVEMESNELLVHKDTRKSEIISSEQYVQHVVDAFQNFMNPFEVEDKEGLYCLSSGTSAPKDVEQQLFDADKLGKQIFEAFIQERLVKKEKSFNDPIKRQNLKTFASTAKHATVKSKEKKAKQIKAERNILGQVALLATQYNLDMEKVMKYPLGPVPWSLATADGAPVRTDKAKLLHALETEHVLAKRPELDSMNCVIDGNAMLQAQVGLPSTFGELAENVFDQLPRVSRTDFVTDTYRPRSIKHCERKRRGTSKPYLLKGSLTKVPHNWKEFMSNSENKQRLIQFLLEEWKKDKYAMKLKDRAVFFVHGIDCTCITSSDGLITEAKIVQDLKSTQEEADTRIILHLLHMAHNTVADKTIVVRSPDTDVFTLLLKFAQQVDQRLLFDTGTGDKRRLIHMQKVIEETGQELCQVLPSLHAYSGCDTVSAFVRKGKLLALKLLRENPEFFSTFKALGSSPTIDEDTFINLERFTCLLYRRSLPYTSLDKLRHDLFQQRYSPKSGVLSDCDGIDMSLLPPCQMSLREHIKRANYQALIWNRAYQAIPDVPSPDGHGWCVTDGHINIKWCSGSLMPEELVDVLLEPTDEEENQEEQSVELNNFTDILYDD